MKYAARNAQYEIRTTSKRNHVLDSGGLLIDLDDLVARRHTEVSRHALVVSFAGLPNPNRMLAEDVFQLVQVGRRAINLNVYCVGQSFWSSSNSLNRRHHASSSSASG